MLSAYERELKKSLTIDFYKAKSDEMWPVCVKFIRKTRLKRNTHIKLLRKNLRFIVTRAYLTKSRLWYFAKKNYLYSHIITTNSNISVVSNTSKDRILSIINDFNKIF